MGERDTTHCLPGAKCFATYKAFVQLQEFHQHLAPLIDQFVHGGLQPRQQRIAAIMFTLMVSVAKAALGIYQLQHGTEEHNRVVCTASGVRIPILVWNQPPQFYYILHFNTRAFSSPHVYLMDTKNAKIGKITEIPTQTRKCFECLARDKCVSTSLAHKKAKVEL